MFDKKFQKVPKRWECEAVMFCKYVADYSPQIPHITIFCVDIGCSV